MMPPLEQKANNRFSLITLLIYSLVFIMKFKTLILATSCLVTLSATANAAPIVEFRGEVIDQTCKSSINSQTDSTVLLAEVQASELSTVGKTAAVTPFTIKVEGCAINTAGLSQSPI